MIDTPILVTEGISKVYGRSCGDCLRLTAGEHENACPVCHAVVAIRDVSFSLFQGELLGVMGESGSGKSTLLRLLHLQETPSSGELTYSFSGEATKPFSTKPNERRRFRNRYLSFVYQNPRDGLLLHVSAGGNVAERLLERGWRSYGDIRRRAAALLERAEVPAGRIDDTPDRFSGGMQQRVQIAKALSTEPALAFLDEITTGLDVSVQAKILDLILELQLESGVSMIIVTHDLGVIRLLADRTLVMRHGTVVESGLSDQILEDPQHPYTQQLVASQL